MSDLKTSVQQQFDRVAANYRTSAVHALGVDLAQTVALADLRGDERVLDAGCGAGHTAAAFAPHVAAVVAVDLTEGMLRQVELLAAERGLANLVTRRGDVESLPFDDAEFDLVVSRYSAHHWPHPAKAVAELRRVLRPGGRVILSDVVGFDNPICDTYLNAIELLRDPSHVRDYTEPEWLAFFTGAGLRAEVVYRWRIQLEFENWTERMATSEVNRAAIRSLYASAPAEVKAAMGISEAGHEFACAVVCGV
ncbi:MAG: class I SAM-dependent methyltransferase [Chloroflexi bacterium]|nr:class I SAM-dependent methyltransferase [Chloroflexota bacterium]